MSGYFEEYLLQLPVLLLYAFAVYCLPIIVFRCIRRCAVMRTTAILIVSVYMFCAFLISFAIRQSLSQETAIGNIPILWGFIDYYVLVYVSPRDIRKVNVYGFNTRKSYLQCEKQQMISVVAPEILQQCYAVRMQKRALKKLLNQYIADKEIDKFQASILYQEYMKEELSDDLIVDMPVVEVQSNDQPQRKYRKGWGWSVAALVAWFPVAFFNSGAFTLLIEDVAAFIGLGIAVIGIVLHLVFYMNNQKIKSVGSLVVALCNLLVLLISFFTQIVAFSIEQYDFLMILVMIPFIPLFVCYTLHLSRNYRNVSQLKMPSSIKRVEKAYEKIAKFHDYKEKGIMTEEEFEKCKLQILAKIEE